MPDPFRITDPLTPRERLLDYVPGACVAVILAGVIGVIVWAAMLGRMG